MKITWYGQASFAIESEAGLRVVTDPYDSSTSGFKAFPDPADIVIKSSSTDAFHCNDHLVPKRTGATVIDALEIAESGGETVSHGIVFRTIEAMEHVDHDMHDPERDAMYRFNIDGLEIGHMGDVGNPFSEEQVEFFRGVNVLLSLAGGFPVIELEELKRIVNLTNPEIVIPMHFRTLCFKLRNMHWISEFLKHFPEEDVDFAFGCSAHLSKDRLPDKTRALVLDYL